jgi:hypothetical protein
MTANDSLPLHETVAKTALAGGPPPAESKEIKKTT